MNLYLLRHGLAVVHTDVNIQTDRQRPLTAEGLKKTRRVAKAMQAMELAFDQIWSSPFLRAQQTAEVVAREFDRRDAFTLTDDLVPDASPRGLVKRLQDRHLRLENLLIVGHEPFLSSLISLLVCGALEPRVVLKKSGLAKLALGPATDGPSAVLEWLLTPKQMLLMA